MTRRNVGNQHARRPLETRFWEKVAVGSENQCWEWQASKDGCGYGFIGLGNGKLGKSHRVSWELHNGPIPAGLCVLHHCDNPPCVNPRHLFVGTQKDNADDRERKGRMPHYSGADHWTVHSPERLPCGDHHWSRKQEVPTKGEKNGRAKLTWEQVRSIRAEYSAGGIRQKDLGAKYGVSQHVICGIVNEKFWKEPSS